MSLTRSRYKHLCGGSLLSATRALTAAQCLQTENPPSKHSIMAGSTRRRGDADAQFRKLSRFLSHPKYNPKRGTNDIGLLFWEEPLTLGETVRAIALPPQSSPVPRGVNCTVTGWGRTAENGSNEKFLRVVTKPIISNKECNQSYKGRITSDMLCAGLPEGGRGACDGDNGGPLVINNALVGVASWGRGCGKPGFPGVYARVPFFTDWIIENIVNVTSAR